MDKNKILITYFTRTGNTKAVAEIIHDQIGGTLFPIETSNPLPNDYENQVQQNVTEQNEDVLPRLKNMVPNFSDYKYIFIGTPTWNMALPQAVKSFLTEYDFSNQTVIPFNTNGGYGAGSTFKQIAAAVSPATVLPGLVVTGGQETNHIYLAIKGLERERVAQKVSEWLRKIE